MGEGIQPEHLKDEPLDRVLDKLYDPGLTEIFIRVALLAADRFGVKMDSFHLDSSSFHVHGDYGTGTDEASAQSGLITITYGYSATPKRTVLMHLYQVKSQDIVLPPVVMIMMVCENGG
ncbi:hypothetical protein RintRC_0750 [Richelia intracellularis]|nr:hypothetical protein RintRC_0750 [Richelia intracellularis]